jgi:prophage regulatory protein
MEDKQIIKLPQVKELTTFSSATIYRLISKGEFPKQIKLAERSSGWLRNEIDSWLESKIQDREELQEELE